MANFTAADIKTLREQTGAGMLDVKKALDEADGDHAKATEILRVKGQKGVTKREGRTTSKGMPKPLDFALFVREYADEVQGAFPPVWVQQATMAPLAWVARKRGHAERYAPAYAPVSPAPALA